MWCYYNKRREWVSQPEEEEEDRGLLDENPWKGASVWIQSVGDVKSGRGGPVTPDLLPPGPLSASTMVDTCVLSLLLLLLFTSGEKREWETKWGQGCCEAGSTSLMPTTLPLPHFYPSVFQRQVPSYQQVCVCLATCSSPIISCNSKHICGGRASTETKDWVFSIPVPNGLTLFVLCVAVSALTQRTTDFGPR